MPNLLSALRTLVANGANLSLKVISPETNISAVDLGTWLELSRVSNIVEAKATNSSL